MVQPWGDYGGVGFLGWIILVKLKKLQFSAVFLGERRQREDIG